MRSGILRHRIDIRQLDDAVDTEGAPTQVYTNLHANVPAKVMEKAVSETSIEGQTESSKTTEIRCRALSGITPAMRVYWGTRIYEITGTLDPNGRDRWMTILAREMVEEVV